MTKVDDWLAWLIPRRCVLCNESSGAQTVCGGCRDDLPWLRRRCPACGEEPGPGAGGACGRCGVPLADPVARAAFSYEYPVDRMITAAKFRGELHHARALGALLATAWPAGPAADLLVPVPLHRRRLLERGYNQALEIARPVAARTGIALAPDLCERIRPTREQSGLPASERRRNLRGAFAVRGRCAGARVAIIDDVITTGSTAAALARTLRAAGAEVVAVWAVARALPRTDAATPS
jgi:ComF family protein